MAHCTGSLINRNWIGISAYDLRHRTGYSSGQGTHGPQHTEHFEAGFADTTDDWIVNLNYFSEIYYPPSRAPLTVNWVGDVGVGDCGPPYHGLGRAFDLTRIQFTQEGGGSTFCDMNWSWLPERIWEQRRRYLAIAAQARRYFGTVLTCWYNSAHENHIHFDNGVASGAISESKTSDTTLIQAACNLLNGESLSIDGSWGPVTGAAYLRLLGDFNLLCLDARDSTANKNTFLSYVVRTGFANQGAGAYQSGACGPSGMDT